VLALFSRLLGWCCHFVSTTFQNFPPTKDTIELRQPHLIQQILDKVGMLPQSKTKDKAAPSSTILHRDLDGSPFQEKWDYCRIIGKLNFLEKSTRPEIAYAVHHNFPRCNYANSFTMAQEIVSLLMDDKNKDTMLPTLPMLSIPVFVVQPVTPPIFARTTR
jgi:hypothetical protein